MADKNEKEVEVPENVTESTENVSEEVKVEEPKKEQRPFVVIPFTRNYSNEELIRCAQLCAKNYSDNIIVAYADDIPEIEGVDIEPVHSNQFKTDDAEVIAALFCGLKKIPDDTDFATILFPNSYIVRKIDEFSAPFENEQNDRISLMVPFVVHVESFKDALFQGLGDGSSLNSVLITESWYMYIEKLSWKEDDILLPVLSKNPDESVVDELLQNKKVMANFPEARSPWLFSYLDRLILGKE